MNNKIKKILAFMLSVSMAASLGACSPQHEEVVVNQAVQGSTSFKLDTSNDKQCDLYVENFQRALNGYTSDIFTFINGKDTRQLELLNYLSEQNLHKLFGWYLKNVDLTFVKAINIGEDTYLAINAEYYDNYYNDFKSPIIANGENPRGDFIKSVDESMKEFVAEYEQNQVEKYSEFEKSLQEQIHINNLDPDILNDTLKIIENLSVEAQQGLLWKILDVEMDTASFSKDGSYYFITLDEYTESLHAAKQDKTGETYRLQELYKFGGITEPNRIGQYCFVSLTGDTSLEEQYMKDLLSKMEELNLDDKGIIIVSGLIQAGGDEVTVTQELENYFNVFRTRGSQNIEVRKNAIDRRESDEAAGLTTETESVTDKNYEFETESSQPLGFQIPRETIHYGRDYNSLEDIAEWVGILESAKESNSLQKVTSMVLAKVEQGQSSTYVSFSSPDLIRLMGNTPVFHSLDRKYSISSYDTWWAYINSEDTLDQYEDLIYNNWKALDSLSADDFRQYIINATLLDKDVIKDNKVYGKYYLVDNFEDIRRVTLPEGFSKLCEPWYSYEKGMQYNMVMYSMPSIRDFVETYREHCEVELLKQLSKTYYLRVMSPDLNSLVVKYGLESMSGFELINKFNELIKAGDFNMISSYVSIDLQSEVNSEIGYSLVSDYMSELFTNAVHPVIEELAGLNLPWECTFNSQTGKIMYNGEALETEREQLWDLNLSNKNDLTAESIQQELADDTESEVPEAPAKSEIPEAPEATVEGEVPEAPAPVEGESEAPAPVEGETPSEAPAPAEGEAPVEGETPATPVDGETPAAPVETPAPLT